MDLAKKSILKISESGADAVKIQTWKTENIILENCRMVEYQQKNTGSEQTQYEMLKNLELPYEWHEELKTYAEGLGLVFFSTMEDQESVDFLLKECKISLIKVGSGDLTNYPLIRYTAKFGVPMILSTGMCSLEEIGQALEIIKEEKNNSVVLLQCTTGYPVDYDEINLSAMVSMREKFGRIIGFSDHSLGDECAIAAVALGAKYIEKHFTLDKTLPGPDHKASLEPHELGKMIRAIRNVERALGNGIKKPASSELKIRSSICRRIVASKDIRKDELIDEENVNFKRSMHGIEAREFYSIKGKKVRQKIDCNKPIEREYLD
ncbi:MAG: N-acetylneuraminate synthase family protein [Methanoregula sp.]